MKYRVAVVECNNYQPEEIGNAINTIFQLLDFTFDENKIKQILIKPNLLKDSQPEQAITTHPAIIERLIHKLKQKNMDIKVGDSPGFGLAVEKVAEAAGIREICNRLSVPIVDLGKGKTFEFDTGTKVGCLPMSQYVDQSQIISVPKVKTSRGVLLTCGVKNMFGCIAGESKSLLHQYGRDVDTFYTTLNNICNRARPVLTIADGITIMEGNGPDEGTPRHLGLMFAGTDPYAVDWVVSWALGLNPKAVGTIRFHRDSTLEGFEDIEIVGVSPESFPRIHPELPKLLSARLQRWCSPRMENN